MENNSIKLKSPPVPLASMRTRIYQVFLKIKPIILPLFLAVFPSLFHYGNNAAILLLSSLWKMVVFNLLITIIVFLLYFVVSRYRPLQAANSTAIFLLFFNTYGIVFTFILNLDVIRVEHYTLLPLYILVAIYTSWMIQNISESRSLLFWKGSLLIIGLLIIFNVIKIIPVEITKAKGPPEDTPMIAKVDPLADKTYPDIYYIVFDEFSGFYPMREYWHNKEVDKFVQFLENNEFVVFEDSHSHTEDTLYELATRLNYQEYPCCDNFTQLFEAISNNNVTAYLKTKGYKFVAFEELRAAFPADIPFTADYLYESDPNSPSASITFFSDFRALVFDNTMLSAFPSYYKNQITDPFLEQHQKMINYTVGKIANIPEVPVPKFVYIHLLLPHIPFMFDKLGNVIGQQYHDNWNYYLGNYNYSIQVLEKMVRNLMSQIDPKRPPIIVLQSDHGARNLKIEDNEVLLENFPDDFKTSILFAMYIPGYDVSTIPQNVDPINTFPIIFNYLFDAEIPLR